MSRQTHIYIHGLPARTRDYGPGQNPASHASSGAHAALQKAGFTQHRKVGNAYTEYHKGSAAGREGSHKVVVQPGGSWSSHQASPNYERSDKTLGHGKNEASLHRHLARHHGDSARDARDYGPGQNPASHKGGGGGGGGGQGQHSPHNYHKIAAGMSPAEREQFGKTELGKQVLHGGHQSAYHEAAARMSPAERTEFGKTELGKQVLHGGHGKQDSRDARSKPRR